VEFDTSTRTCRAHPTIVGEDEASGRRGQGCGKTTPIIAFTYGYYCPQVIARIQEELPTLHIEPEVTPEGVVLMKDILRVLEETEGVRGFPKK